MDRRGFLAGCAAAIGAWFAKPKKAAAFDASGLFKKPRIVNAPEKLPPFVVPQTGYYLFTVRTPNTENIVIKKNGEPFVVARTDLATVMLLERYDRVEPDFLEVMVTKNATARLTRLA